MGIWSTIRNLFKIAKLLSVDDSGNLRFAQVTMLGKTQPMMLFTPYGLMSNPPPNSLALVWAQQAQESNLIGMADAPMDRTVKNLSPGEVALGNYSTGNFIYFDKNGLCTIFVDDLKILAENDIEIIGKNIRLSATDDFSVVSNTSSIDASVSMDLSAPDIGITATNLKHGGVNIGATHIHSQGTDSSGDTEQDTGAAH